MSTSNKCPVCNIGEIKHRHTEGNFKLEHCNVYESKTDGDCPPHFKLHICDKCGYTQFFLDALDPPSESIFKRDDLYESIKQNENPYCNECNDY